MWRFLNISLSTVHIIIHRLRESEDICAHKEQGWKWILHACDVRGLRQRCFKNTHDSVMEITAQAQEHFQKLLFVKKVHCLVHKFSLKRHHAKMKQWKHTLLHLCMMELHWKLAYFSKTLLNHILLLLQQYGFTAVESGCWTDLQPRLGSGWSSGGRADHLLIGRLPFWYLLWVETCYARTSHSTANGKHLETPWDKINERLMISWNLSCVLLWINFVFRIWIIALCVCFFILILQHALSGFILVFTDCRLLAICQ